MIASQNESRRPRLGPARRSRQEGGLRPVTGATYPNWDAVYRDYAEDAELTTRPRGLDAGIFRGR